MEGNIKLLIANEDSEETNNISQKLTEENSLWTVDKAYNGKDALELIENNIYDIVITDIILPEIDGFELIERIKSMRKDSKIIVLTALTSDTFIKKAMSLDVDYYMMKPTNLSVLMKRIDDLFDDGKVENTLKIKSDSDKEIEEKITNIFITVGIPAHIKGYQFLREAVKLAMENPDIINSITKKLYPSIAERFDTSASKVERAIRHAIEVAWNRGKIENINNIFGLTVYSNNEKPTNGEFMALVADKMLLDV